MTYDFVPDDHVVPYERGSEHFVYTPAEQTWGDLCLDLAQVRVSEATVAQYVSAAKKDRREIKRNAAGGLITLARIASDYRNAKGRRTLDASAVEFFTGLEVDIDQGSPEQRERIRADAVAGTGPVFGGFEYVVFDSFSSLPSDWRGKILVPFAEQVGLDEHLECLRGFAVSLERHYGVAPDPTSIASAHGQYVPARLADSVCTVRRVRGPFVDVARLRQAAKDYAPPTAAKEKAGAKKKAKEQPKKPRTQATGIVAEINARWPEVLAVLGIEVVASPRRASERAICCPLGDRPYSEPMLDIDDDGDWICRVCPPGTGGHFISLVARIVGGSNAEATTRCCEILGLAAPPLDADEVVALAKKCGKDGAFAAKAAVLDTWRRLSKDARALTNEQVRKAIGVKASDMDAPTGAGGDDCEDGMEGVREHEPWPDAVDIAAHLDDIVYFIQRFVVLPVEAVHAIALWTVHTHASVRGAFPVAGYLNIASPVADCGKSTLLDIVAALCARPELMSGLTNAVAFRLIHTSSPTMLIDEVDQLFKDPKANADLIATINLGHRRGATIPRCVGDDYAVKRFRCFAPYVLAGIGALPPTHSSRAIRITLQHAAESEIREQLGLTTIDDAWELGRKSARWIADNFDPVTVAATKVQRLPNLRARQNNCWGPLFAVAALAQGPWPARALAAATSLSGGRETAAGGPAIALLVALREIFEDHDALYSKTICETLMGEDYADGPWRRWDKWEGFSQSALATTLKPFEVVVKKVRERGGVPRQGYSRAQLARVWERYAPRSVDSCFEDLSGTTEQQHKTSGLEPEQGAEHCRNTAGTPEHLERTERGQSATFDDVPVMFRQCSGQCSGCPEHPKRYDLQGCSVVPGKTPEGTTTRTPGLWDAPAKTTGKKIYHVTKAVPS